MPDNSVPGPAVEPGPSTLDVPVPQRQGSSATPRLQVVGEMPDRLRVADYVYNLLRRSIFDHSLPPGSRLSVPSIAVDLGVSRSPVREAVQRLVRDGLATEEPHKGAAVMKLAAHELIPLYEVREVIEGLAARLAAQRATREHLADLRWALSEHSESIERGDVEGHVAADLRFHAIMRDAAQNPELSSSMERIDSKVVVAILSGDVHRWPIQALAEHNVIFGALVMGDADGAEAAARAHIARIRAGLAAREGVQARPGDQNDVSRPS